MKSDELRASFLSFFAERGHVELPSLPLILPDDPSVLFVTAGMQQMIPFFIGESRPPCKRLTSIQKCLRTVDIEEVGDESHLTFFEMLGNFSVGDYYVPEALRFTWAYLTEVLAIPAERLWATVYPGDELAERTWLEIGLPADRIVQDPSNWWTRAGLAGPAGPDSEVHFDRGLEYGCGLPDCGPVDGRPGCHRFVEIWNNVFMDSFVNEKNEVQRPLSAKNIDTGQGFERLLMAVQGVETVYETDVFAPVVDAVAVAVGTTYGTDADSDRSLRVIADHCRAVSMAIADGGMPGSEGRGYVLRRLIRRSVLRGHLLGLDRVFLREPVSEVIRVMSPRYPNLRSRAESILEAVELEEERFAEMLVRGKPLLEELLEAAGRKGTRVPGGQAFLLHDTYGLPLELIVEMAVERGLAVDIAGFEEALGRQRARGRAARATGVQRDLESFAALAETVDATTFVGYTQLETESVVVGLIGGGEQRDEVAVGGAIELVLDRTPFYAEAGGQVGDTGMIIGPRGSVQIADTRRPFGALVAHGGRVTAGTIRLHETVTARVDQARRSRILPHHSATHLLHLALRETLGPEATQAGSLVAPDHLRFDFRWPRALTGDELDRIQTRVNDLVFAGEPVITRETSYGEAVAAGAMALFGEKYGDVVRLVQMGPSKELCGGTHVVETRDIGPVVILSETGIGSGVRRIEALAGRPAYGRFVETERMLRAAAKALGAPADRLAERAGEVARQLKAAEKRAGLLTSRLIAARGEELANEASGLNGGGEPAARLIVRNVSADSSDDLFQLAAAAARSLGSGVVVVGSVIEGKPHFAAAVSKDLSNQGYNARAIAQKVGGAVGGGAGGSEVFAQGGGRDGGGLDAGLEAAEEFIRGEKL